MGEILLCKINLYEENKIVGTHFFEDRLDKKEWLYFSITEARKNLESFYQVSGKNNKETSGGSWTTITKNVSKVPHQQFLVLF